MKKFTLILISVFMFGALMAQTGQGPVVTYNYMGSQANALYTQMNPQPATFSVTSQQFSDLTNYIAQDADDFTVPAGPDWSITGVNFLGNYYDSGNGPAPTPYGPAASFNVEIYTDNGGLPGTLLHSFTNLTYTETSGLFSVTLPSAVVLSSGTYWISIYATMSYAAEGEWGWAWNKDPQQGNQFVNQDPNGVIGSPWPTSWAYGSGVWPNQTQYDLCFELEGNAVGSVPVSNWAIILGVFLIGAFMVVRYRRTLA